jgi:hypothetical protein
MATQKQVRAITKMVENGGNVSKAMIEAGYSVNTARTPQKLTNSKGYRALLDDYGLREELILQCLLEDIFSKPGSRVQELALLAKIMGLYIDRQDIRRMNINVSKPYEEMTDDELDIALHD